MKLRIFGCLAILCLLQSGDSLADSGPIYLRVKSTASSAVTVMDNTDPKKADVQYELTPDQYVVCEKTEKGFCIIHGLASDGSEKIFYLKLEDSKLEREKAVDAKIHMALDHDRVTTAIYDINNYQIHHSNCPAGARCAWPNGGAEVTLGESRMVQVADPQGDELRWEMAYNVSGTYTPRNSGGQIIGDPKPFQGWVADQFITADLEPVPAPPPAYKPPTPPTPVPCPPVEPAPSAKNLNRLGDDVAAVHKRLKDDDDQATWENVARRIEPLVGECRLPENFHAVRSVAVAKKPAFTSVMVPYWEEKSSEYQKNPPAPVHIPGPGNRKLDMDHLVAIDTLARTLYGEMDRCFENSLGYPKAVAKVTLNRVEALDTKAGKKFRFENGTRADAPSWLKNNDFLSVLLDPKQYSAWNNNDNNLKRVLCPPSRKEKRDPKGQSIWKEAVRIAIETVLNPDQLKREATGVHGYYYTSGIPFLPGFHSYPSSVDGKDLDSRRCIILWE